MISNLDGIIILSFPLFSMFFLIIPLLSPYFIHISRSTNVKCFRRSKHMPCLAFPVVLSHFKLIICKDKHTGTVRVSLKAFSPTPFHSLLMRVLWIGQNGCYLDERVKVQWSWFRVSWLKWNSFRSSHHIMLNMAFTLSPFPAIQCKWSLFLSAHRQFLISVLVE